jgi:hypothetical protein
MKFEEVLKELRQGKIARRRCYADYLVIFMQVPAYINCEDTWNMKSLPNDMKILLKQHHRDVKYEDQFIIYDLEDQVATYHVFDGEDINATDWEVIDPFCYTYE